MNKLTEKLNTLTDNEQRTITAAQSPLKQGFSCNRYAQMPQVTDVLTF